MVSHILLKCLLSFSGIQGLVHGIRNHLGIERRPLRRGDRQWCCLGVKGRDLGQQRLRLIYAGREIAGAIITSQEGPTDTRDECGVDRKGVKWRGHDGCHLGVG